MIELHLPLPPSVNNLYTAVTLSYRKKKDRVVAFEWEVRARVLRAYPVRPVLVPPLAFEAHLFLDSKRPIFDVDNGLKILIDALADSFQFQDNGIRWIYADKEHDHDEAWSLVRLHDNATRATLGYLFR